MLNKTVGLMAAFILSFSQYLVTYGQEARPYALLAFLSIISTYFLLNTLKNKDFGIEEWFYVVSAIIGLYTHYFFIFIFGIQTAYLAFELLRIHKMSLIEKLKFHLRLSAPVSLAFSVWAFYKFIPRFVVSNPNIGLIGWIQKPTFKSIADLLKNFTGLTDLPDTVFLLLAFVVLLIFIFPIFNNWLKYREIDWSSIYIALAFILPIIAVFIISFKNPIFVERYLIIILPFLALFLACAIWNLKYKAAMVAVLLVLAIPNLQQMNEMYKTMEKEDWRSATKYLAESYNVGDMVIRYNLPNYLTTYYAPADKQFEQGYIGRFNTLTRQKQVETLRAMIQGRLKIFAVYTYYDGEPQNAAVLDGLIKDAGPAFNRTDRRVWNHILIDTYEEPAFGLNSSLQAERVFFIPATSFTGRFAKPYNGILPFYSSGDIAIYNLELEKGKYLFSMDASGEQPGPLYIKYTLGPASGTFIVGGNLSQWHHYEIPITLERRTSFRITLEFINDTYIEKNGVVIADNEAFIRNIKLVKLRPQRD